MLGGAVLAGLGLSWAVHVGEMALGLLLAFLGGGAILNTLEEEVPAERSGRFWTFALGAASYAGLMLLMAA